MLLDEFKKKAGEVTTLVKPEERDIYSHDIGDIPAIMMKTLFKTLPDFVVQPKTLEEIQKVITFAHEQKIPAVIRGAASWGFGGVIPTHAGLVIDLSPFRNIKSIDTAKKTVTVEAGARWSDIDIVAKKQGLCLMTYPSSKFSTVGGWLSTGGYGINSFRYGHISKQIVTLTVITGKGEVRQVTPADRDFSYYISTEGEFGVVGEVTLKLRDIPEGSYPHLMYFPDDGAAFRFIERFVRNSAARQLKPSVIRFLDANAMADMNEVVRAAIFKKSPAVLMEFSSSRDDKNFMQFMDLNRDIEQAPDHAANYLWNERLFGMKTKRLGPTILASEVIIPLESAALFFKKAKKLAGYFGVEVTIDSYIIDDQKALIMANFLCDSRKKKYYINVPLVAMLTRTALSLGAEPYGLGLWNSGFIHKLYDTKRQQAYQVFKNEADPHHVLNRGKAFSAGENGIRGMIFRPAVFNPAVQMLIWTAPVTGRLATILLGKNKKVDRLDVELSLHACAKCGNCMAVCPAYLVTRNEEVTAKGKIAIAKKIIAHQTVTKEEAAAAFQCMHCRACEEICQTNLELMKLWDALESKLDTRFGRPAGQITDFLKRVDESKEYWDMVERNN